MDYTQRRARNPLSGKNELVDGDMTYNEWIKSLTPEQKQALETASGRKSTRVSDKLDQKLAETQYKRDITKAVDNSAGSGIIKVGSEAKVVQSGAFYGALNPESEKDFERCEEHARKYYEEIRKRKSDIKAIAGNTDFSEQEIEIIKSHLFINKYDLGEDEPETFYPSYDIAVSWQNLIDGKRIEEKDIILLKHEHYEYNLMKEQNLSYAEAHEMTQELYNYQKAVEEWRSKK